MRILHLATFLQGGAGRVIADLAVAQKRAGHAVSVVTSRTGAPGYGNYEGHLDKLRAAGIQLHLVDSMFSRDQRANLDVVHFLNGSIEAGAEPHVMHAHAATPSAVALLFAGARRGRPAILQTMHGWGVRKTADQSARDVGVMNLVDCVVVPSKHSAAMLESIGVRTDRIEIIPYGVNANDETIDDDAAAVCAAMQRARSEGRLVVACVGTIGARKNQTLLVDALARLGPDVPVFCVFIGDGDTAGLQVSIGQAGIENRARVHGYSPAARALAAAADVLVLPSRSEGQPIAVLEAFCDGPLVLVSDIPELAEVVQDRRNGFQFEAENAESLAQCLRFISAAPTSFRHSVQDRARATYLQHFTGQAMIDAYAELYDAMCVSMAWQAGVVPAA